MSCVLAQRNETNFRAEFHAKLSDVLKKRLFVPSFVLYAGSKNKSGRNSPKTIKTIRLIFLGIVRPKQLF